MQVVDKEVQQKLKEDDPNYIDLAHIPTAQAMLVKIVYVRSRGDFALAVEKDVASCFGFEVLAFRLWHP